MYKAPDDSSRPAKDYPQDTRLRKLEVEYDKNIIFAIENLFFANKD